MAYQDIVYQTDPSTGQLLFDADGYPLPDGTANAGASTYGDMQARVYNEVLGAITAVDVKTFILDAIASYERMDFYGNSIRYFGDLTGSSSDLQTIQGKEFYSYADLPILANMPHIMKVMVLAFNNRYPLIQRTPQWIDDQSISPTWNGLPTDWCMYPSGMLRLYPIPNGGYPLILEGTIRFRPLAEDADYSFWTNRAERLIRIESKRRLFREMTRDADQAAAMELELSGDPRTGRQGAFSELVRETVRRAGGPGSLRASRGYF